LALQVVGDLGPLELARARLLNGQRGARDEGGRVEEADPALAAEPLGAPGDAFLHDAPALGFEWRQGFERVNRRRRQYVRVALQDVFTKQKSA
jgi:hypothetical protein